MKVEILKTNFKTGLNIIEKIIGKNLSLPILDNVLITTEDSFLKLTSTDLETAIKWWILAKISKKGKIIVPARFLSNFISLLPEEKIILEEKNQALLIECKNYKTQIQGFNPDDFPIIPEVKDLDFIEVDSERFSIGLSQIVDVASPSQARPEISGIYFRFLIDSIKMVATDSFRLAEKTILLDKKNNKERSFILPQKPAREIINILGERKGRVKIYFSPNQVLFEFPMEEISHPQVHVLSRLIEGEYPNYQEIIPKKFKTNIIVKKDEFLNQIRAAALFGGKINEVKFTINPKKKEIEIFAQSPNIGEFKSVLSAKIEGELIETSFNYKFLIDGLLNIKSSEVIFGLSREDGPSVLRPVGDASYIYIAMPIKTT